MLLRPGKRTTLARPDTAIVIEGFLRSGNTFAVAAFRVANGPDVHIGRHLHGAPHVLRAVRYGVPTVIHKKHNKTPKHRIIYNTK